MNGNSFQCDRLRKYAVSGQKPDCWQETATGPTDHVGRRMQWPENLLQETPSTWCCVLLGRDSYYKNCVLLELLVLIISLFKQWTLWQDQMPEGLEVSRLSASTRPSQIPSNWGLLAARSPFQPSWPPYPCPSHLPTSLEALLPRSSLPGRLRLMEVNDRAFRGWRSPNTKPWDFPFHKCYSLLSGEASEMWNSVQGKMGQKGTKFSKETIK